MEYMGSCKALRVISGSSLDTLLGLYVALWKVLMYDDYCITFFFLLSHYILVTCTRRNVALWEVLMCGKYCIPIFFKPVIIY